MILLQIVSSSQWTVQSFDITAAFLRGKGDGRQSAVDPVPELREMMRQKNLTFVCWKGMHTVEVMHRCYFTNSFIASLKKYDLKLTH